MTTVPSLLRRGRIVYAVAALLSAGALSGCWDEPERSITEPDGPRLGVSSGTWPPELASHVRVQPHVVSAGKTYRIWFLIKSTAPETRRYVVFPWQLPEQLEFDPLTYEYTLAPGETRWIPLNFAVKSSAPDNTEYQFYVGAHDMVDQSYGRTDEPLTVKVANSFPVVAIEGGEHQVAVSSQPDTIHTWIYNAQATSQTYCFRWLEDEGYTLGDIPQFLYAERLGSGEARCKTLGPQEGFDTAFVYTYGWTPFQRQTFQVWNHLDGNQRAHAYRKTTVVSSAPQTNRFYAFTVTRSIVGPGSPIPLMALTDTISGYQDRHYLSLSYYGDPCKLETYPDKWRALARNWINRGHTYVFYEEQGQGKAGCVLPASEYARAYHELVQTIKGVDPSARIATGWFEQENIYSDPPSDRHFVRYADDFWSAYLATYGVKPPIAEWNWILYMAPTGATNDPRPKTLADWQAEVDSAVAFSLATSRWGWEKGSGQYYGAGAAPVGVGIGFPGDSTVTNWDELMTGMVSHINTATTTNAKGEAVSYRDAVAAAYWWVMEKWKDGSGVYCDAYNPPNGGNHCAFRLSDDGFTLNTYGNRYRSLTQ